MYYRLLKHYIKSLKLEDIKKFCSMNNLCINNHDQEVIYNYLILYHEELYNTDGKEIFQKLKKEVDNSTYIIANDLYKKAKEKINK